MWDIKKTVSKGDYNYAVVDGHPNSTKNNYVLEHRVVMENELGRLLTSDEIVHHVNGNKKDNRIVNLQLTNSIAHAVLHGKQKGRLYVTMKCPECKVSFTRPKSLSFIQKHCRYNCCSNRCKGKFSNKVQRFGDTDEIIQAIKENFVEEFRRF